MSAARFAIVLTAAAWTAYVIDQVITLAQGVPNSRAWAEAVVYFLVATLLTLSALAYLLCRLGYLYRTRDHRRVPRATIDDFFGESMPTLTALVPSYREDARVIRQTLLSAALQEYPFLRVVLLIDDPPTGGGAVEQRQLADARAVPGQIQALLAEPRARFEDALESFERSSVQDGPGALRTLAGLYDEASSWAIEQAGREVVVDHTDAFLADHVLGRLGADLAEVAEALRLAADAGAEVSHRRILQLHRRLVWTFSAELSSFERKQFASLSSEPNKAMNLNSYIGLMGRRFRVLDTNAGRALIEVRGETCDLEVPDPDYVLTLDADSILLPEYCLRLVHHLESPAGARVAVAQTPYSAYPGAPTRIERISGATTDLQHIAHLGMTHYGATYWVGANAVLRKSALDDICELDLEDGLPIRRYIQDRTPIEDTESSLDIRLRGWQLYNYPERLSYSATPGDFGSLCIQRQRWANGGLNMVPKLWSFLQRRRRDPGFAGRAEVLLRLNYLSSIAWASIGLFILLAYPYDDRLVSPVALLVAIPYFVAMSTDLRRCGYRRTDVLRIYGFNLLLLPVNTSGVIKSVEQAIGGQKIAFARTPKVRNRTAAPISFVVIPYLIVLLSAWTLWRDLSSDRLSHAVFAGSNALLTAYAIVAFVGIRFSIADVWVNVRERLYVPVRPAPEPQPTDWVSVLYHGTGDGPSSSSVSTTVAALALVDREPSELDNLIDHPVARHGERPQGPPAPVEAATVAPRRRWRRRGRQAPDALGVGSLAAAIEAAGRSGSEVVIRLAPTRPGGAGAGNAPAAGAADGSRDHAVIELRDDPDAAGDATVVGAAQP